MNINKNAIFSILCSIIAIFIFWWLAICGIGFGIRSLQEIKTTNEKGKTLAVLGIAIGTVGIILFYITKFMNM